jgi:hypothetical protein
VSGPGAETGESTFVSWRLDGGWRCSETGIACRGIVDGLSKEDPTMVGLPRDGLKIG